MKLVSENLKTGQIVLIPQDSDDLYTLYNLIVPGDKIKTKTSRRIKSIEGGQEGSSRLLVTIAIESERIEFQGFGDLIRVKGKIYESSDTHVTLGSYHTLKIELLKKITIEKTNWSTIDLERLHESQLGTPSGLIIVSIDDQSAIISQVGTHATRILLELNPSIPRKSSDTAQHENETKNFFSTIVNFLREKKEAGIAEYIVIGGPGFTRESFVDYFRQNYPKITTNLLSVATNSSGRSGIQEIVSNHLPENYIAGKIAERQATLINRCMEELGKDTGLIAYGTDVNVAVELGAVDHLLVLDSDLRESIEKRERLYQLIELVKQNRGKIFIMSSMHETSGSILKGLGGVLALLRFKLPKK